MKTFQTLVFFLFLGIQATLAQGFFYFGTTNMVGTGNMLGDNKEGSWRIYTRKIQLDNPSPAVAAVEEQEVKEKFNLDVPLYQMEFKENLLDGIFEEFYPEGTTKKVVNYQKGMLHGDFFEFTKEGELLLSGTYFQGEKSGDWFVYRSDGSLKSEYSYQNNLLDGTSISYYVSGQVAERIPFQKGEINGVYESFFPDGNPKQRVTFVAGQEEGEFTQFHADGKLAIKANFSKGILDGVWEEYDDQGRLLAQGSYRQGDRFGEWKEVYSEIPGFFQKGNYEKGVKSGAWQVLGPSDFVHQEETYQNGILVTISAFTTQLGEVLDAGSLTNGDGRRVLYDGDGNRLEKGRYTNGMRTGTWYSYFPETSLVASSGTYAGGQKRGTWKQYDFKGQLVSEQVFEVGPSQEPEQSLNPQSTTAQNRSKLYRPNQSQNGRIKPQIFVLTPDGGIGVSGPGMFQLGN